MACNTAKIQSLPVGSPQRNALVKACFDEQRTKNAAKSQKVRDAARKAVMNRKPAKAPSLTPTSPMDAVKREFSSKTYNP